MKALRFSALVLVLWSVSSCAAIETVFKAGMWWGIIVIVAVIALIGWVFTRGKK